MNQQTPLVLEIQQRLKIATHLRVQVSICTVIMRNPRHPFNKIVSQLNGKNGASGPNAQPLAARGPKSELVLAVNQPWEAFGNVQEIIHRSRIAAQLIAKVNFYIFNLFTLNLSLPKFEPDLAGGRKALGGAAKLDTFPEPAADTFMQKHLSQSVVACGTIKPLAPHT